MSCKKTTTIFLLEKKQNVYGQNTWRQICKEKRKTWRQEHDANKLL